ncbi:MAG: DsbA family protein [Verrucomicrobia bacterium]|nr:DsbA family protein [Verrucomicrobiota bacterium]
MRITYYLEVVSSWCHWAEPAWKQLKEHFAGRAEFEWKIALMDASSMPVSRSQIDWFYRRSGTHMRSPYKLNSAWFQDGLGEYLAPNLVALAARECFGIADDRARHAITHAAIRDGRPVAQWEICAEVAAAACGLDAAELLAKASLPEIEAKARATTAEFHALQVTQRPTFVLENAIGDRAVFSGLAQAAPLIAAGEALLQDAAYAASYKAHYGEPPRA